MNSEKFRVVKQCRVCKSERLTQYLDLGEMPLANALISEEEISQEEKYPLQVMFCENFQDSD